jgi:hypothetical protein
MLNRLGSRSLRTRVVAAAGTLALTVSLVGAAEPAGAAPDDTGPSVIGDGSISDTSDYINATASTDLETDVNAGDEVDGACQTLPGTVSPADIPERYRVNPPNGQGAWEYQLCAKDADAARAAVQAHPDVASARAYCGTEDHPVATSMCGVFVYWRPKIEPPANQPDESRENYFQSFFTLAPQLGSNPHSASRFGFITNLPTWFWNRTETRFPRVIPDLGLFGGVTATAFHLNTEFRTDGEEICSVGGFQLVGDEWDESQPPLKESNECGHTYLNGGTYEVRGCSEWLIIAFAPPFFFIVFPITLCHTWTVPVKEAQVLTGADARRARTG